MWSNEKIEHKKDVLSSQLTSGNGRFALFVIRIYKYIENECKANQSNWCYASKVNKKAINYAYNGPVDHMGYEVIEDVKKHLKEMGYIKYVKEDEKWKIYILKKIDFCNIEDYL